MTPQQAITGFSQSEKIKAGIIWASQVIEMAIGMQQHEKEGPEKIVKLLLGMIAQEIHLAKKQAGDEMWNEAIKHIDMAVVMVNSGVLHETTFHLTQALSRITTIGQRALTLLTEKGLF